MSRWKYKTETVTVGENSQKVRQFTAGERRDFALASKRVGAGEMEAADLPFFVAKLACIDPVLTEEDAKEMPGELLNACCEKITELSGLRAPPADDDEKKDPTSSALPTSSGAAVSH